MWRSLFSDGLWLERIRATIRRSTKLCVVSRALSFPDRFCKPRDPIVNLFNSAIKLIAWNPADPRDGLPEFLDLPLKTTLAGINLNPPLRGSHVVPDTSNFTLGKPSCLGLYPLSGDDFIIDCDFIVRPIERDFTTVPIQYSTTVGRQTPPLLKPRFSSLTK